MAKLTSGDPRQFDALGQGGTCILDNAKAFRNAVNNYLGRGSAKYLADPEVTANGQIVEWYIPKEIADPQGNDTIITWAGASPEERKAAIQELENFKRDLIKKARILERTKDPNSRLFINYATGDNTSRQLSAISFPRQDHVFIVNGTPVITFWGFTEDPYFNGLATLQVANRQGANIPPNANHNFNAMGAGAAIPPQEPLDPPMQEQSSQERRHKCILPPWLLWLLLLLLLIPLLLFLLWKLFGLFAGLFAGLFGAPDTPVMDLTSPPAIEAPLDNSNTAQDSANKVAEPSASDGMGTVDVPLPDVSLPNVNLEGGSLSGGNISMTPGAMDSGANAPSAEAMNNGTNVGDTGAMDSGANVPSAGAMNNGTNAGDTGAMDNGASAPALANSATKSALPPNEDAPAANSSGSDPTMAGNAPASGIVPPNPNMPSATDAARQDAIAAAREAERQAAIEAARAAESQALGQSPAPSPSVVGLPSGSKPLSFNQADLATKGNSVFDGDWQTKSPLMDSTNGRPLQMSYNFKDGQGQVTVTRPDGSKCIAPSTASVVNNGISVTNNGRAVCPDKSTYTLPKINCADSGNGNIKCQGQAGSQHFPVTFYQK